MIEINEVTYSYNNNSNPSLKNINLQINDGEFVLITGPSGSGKSTLVRLLNSLIPQYYGGTIQGSVMVQNYDTFKTPTRILAGIVGMVFQNPENQMLLSDVESEITFGMENLNFTRKEMKLKLEEILDAFEIQHLRKKHSSELSGGEKQKVAIASVLAMNPEILILDEPTAELDPKASNELLNLIHGLNKNKKITILLIEHRLDRVTDFADRIIILNEGKIEFDGSLQDCFYNGIDLDLLGIETPPVIRLYKEFLKNRVKPNFLPLNFKQCKEKMEPYLESLIIKDNNLKLFSESATNTQTELKKKPILIELSNVDFEYSDGRFSLKNINLLIHEGEFISIIGRNGSGKTTLAKLINGLLRHRTGDILIENMDTSDKSVAEISHSVGYIFQNPSIQFYQETVEDEIEFVINNYHMDKITKKKTENSKFIPLVDELLKKFELEKYRRTYPRNLSIGEQQKTALASVLSIKPRILILDEPTHGMDYGQKIKFMQQLNNYKINGNTVILISHDIETIAEFSDRVILMQEGKIIKDDSKRTILSEEKLFSPQINRLVKEFDNIPNNILTFNEILEFIGNENQ